MATRGSSESVSVSRASLGFLQLRVGSKMFFVQERPKEWQASQGVQHLSPDTEDLSPGMVPSGVPRWHACRVLPALQSRKKPTPCPASLSCAKHRFKPGFRIAVCS